MTHLECTEDGANKFWSVTVSGKTLTTHWGRIGTAGQEKTKSFPSPTEAEAEAERLIREKTAKGYRPVAASTEEAPPASKAQAKTGANPKAPAIEPAKSLATQGLPTKGFCNLEALSTGSPDELTELLESADWEAFAPARDLLPLRARLAQVERDEGITAAHRLASERLLRGARFVVATKHRAAITAFALSPCGRYLATGSDSPAGDYDAGGSLVVWEVATGRALRVFEPIDGGIGWSDYVGGLQWSASGRWLGAAFSTNVVGVFDPFAGEPFWCQADVTNSRDTPPAWCFAPDDQRIFISAWGPHEEPGCVVPFAEGGSFDHCSDELRWLSAAPEGAPVQKDGEDEDDEERDDEIPLYSWVRWSPDGACVYGHSRRGPAYAIDTVTGTRRYRTSVEAPVAWSPDGTRFAHGYKRLVVHDGKTGQPTTDLLATIARASEPVFSADGKRLAVVVRTGDDPGVRIIEGGVVRGSLDVSLVQGTFLLLDAQPFAFSPDGARCACLSDEGEIEIWSLDEGPKRLTTIGGAEGLLGLAWGAGEGLVGIGRNKIAFWDATTGALRARYAMIAPPGFAGPPMDLCPYLGERIVAIPVEEGWAWSVSNENGEMLCPPSLRAPVAPLASFVIADRFAWPWAWAVGTSYAPVYDDAGALPVGSPLRNGVRATRPEPKAPFFTVEIGDPRPRAGDSSALSLHEQRQKLLLEAELLSMDLNALPVTRYHATPILEGAQITKAALAPYLGRLMMMAESSRPEHVTIGVISALHDNYFNYYVESKSSSGGGGIEFSKLAWVGPAVPIEPA